MHTSMDGGATTDTHRSIADLHVSLDADTLDAGVGKRKLRTIEPDGTLVYDEPQLPEVKLTETLGRIWAEYPNGMLDISEDALEAKDPDAPAVDEVKATEEGGTTKEKGDIMSAEDMAQMRETILAQLNQSRNELWFVFELAKSLNLSGAYTNNPPPPPSHNPRQRPPAKGPNGPAIRPDNPRDPLVLPAGTISTTPSKPKEKDLIKEVLELELALAAKQAALEECGLLIDSAVDELTSMSAAGDQFWRDVRMLKHGGRDGRNQWAIVPKPDFGGNTAGQKAKDVIIPYAIDEASAGMRARCLAAFDLDPKKKELAFGARTNLRLRMAIIDENGMRSASTLPNREADDASVAKKMDEVQMESFDEELFGEIRAETLRRGSGVVEARLVQFDLGDQNITFELVDMAAPKAEPAPSTSALCDFMLLSTRLSFLQTLRNRKRRLLTSGSSIPPNRSPLVLHPLAQILQYRRQVAQVVSALETLQRTLNSAGIESSLVSRMSLDTPESVVKMLEEGTTDMLGGLFTLDIKDCSGVMVQTTAPISIVVDTSRATIPIADTSELIPVLADAISFQLLEAVLPAVKANAGDLATQIYLSDLEESINVPDQWSLRISIHAPFDSVQAHLDDGSQSYDSKQDGALLDWVGGIMSRIEVD